MEIEELLELRKQYIASVAPGRKRGVVKQERKLNRDGSDYRKFQFSYDDNISAQGKGQGPLSSSPSKSDVSGNFPEKSASRQTRKPLTKSVRFAKQHKERGVTSVNCRG